MMYTLCNSENIILLPQYHKWQTEIILAALRTNFIFKIFISTDALENFLKVRDFSFFLIMWKVIFFYFFLFDFGYAYVHLLVIQRYGWKIQILSFLWLCSLLVCLLSLLRYVHLKFVKIKFVFNYFSNTLLQFLWFLNF